MVESLILNKAMRYLIHSLWDFHIEAFHAANNGIPLLKGN